MDCPRARRDLDRVAVHHAGVPVNAPASSAIRQGGDVTIRAGGRRSLYEHVTRTVRLLYRTDPRCDTQTPVPRRKSMKRFAPLALIVLALAIVPAAFADDGTPAPAQPAAAPATQPAQPHAGRSGIRTRV